MALSIMKLRMLISIVDIALPLLVGFLILELYEGTTGAIYSQQYILPSILFSIISFVLLKNQKLYDVASLTHPIRNLWRIILCNAIAFSCLIMFAFGLKISDHFSRIWAFSFPLASTILQITLRTLIGLWVRQERNITNLKRRIAIIGTPNEAKYFMSHLIGMDAIFTEIIGIYSEQKVNNNHINNMEDCFYKGDIDDLVATVRQIRVDDIVIAMPWNESRDFHAIIERLRELPVTVHLAAAPVVYHYATAWSEGFGDIPALTVQTPPLGGWGTIVKALEDRFLALIALLLFSPVMLLVALAVKLDSPGPIFYRQKRYGFNNQIINVYKFRSMYQRDESKEQGVPQATQNDRRITRVGAFIRKTSLDELPQILNVLDGSMSLVGPRPHAVAHNEQYAQLIDNYFSRHRVKPGITGWAQVNGLRGETDTLEKMKARVEYDIYYIENWSLAFDIRILIHTVFVGFVNKNAY